MMQHPLWIIPASCLLLPVVLDIFVHTKLENSTCVTSPLSIKYLSLLYSIQSCSILLVSSTACCAFSSFQSILLLFPCQMWHSLEKLEVEKWKVRSDLWGCHIVLTYQFVYLLVFLFISFQKIISILLTCWSLFYFWCRISECLFSWKLEVNRCGFVFHFEASDSLLFIHCKWMVVSQVPFYHLQDFIIMNYSSHDHVIVSS